MFCVVTCDIPDDRRRTKVANILENFGDRMQYSVFDMNCAARISLSRCKTVYVPQSVWVRLYVLCGNCRSKVTILGQGTLYEDKDVYIV